MLSHLGIAAIEAFTLAESFAVLLSVICLYLISLIVYRLYLSPLRQYPGPRLAACTQWVETYHELRGGGGQFIFKIDEWHKTYGPMVRISPHEVHIQDSELYEDFYSPRHVTDRPEALQHRFGIPLSSHFTPDHYLHRKRRTTLNPYFSKRKAIAASGSVQTLLHRVCDIVADQYQGKGNALDVSAMWGCVASDAVASYTLGSSFSFTETKGFNSTFLKGMANLLEPIHLVTQFPWVGKILTGLPTWLSVQMQPTMKPVLEFKSAVTDQVRTIKQAVEGSFGNSSKSDLPDTVLATIYRSDLPPSELTIERLRQETIGIIGAGVETVYRALTVGSYHILADDSVRRALEQELEAAISDPSNMPSYDQLTQLPYLAACAKEVQRIGIGTSQRSARIFRRTVPLYTAQPLVPNHVFSMSIRDVHFDPEIYPSPHEFRPERWLPSHSRDTASLTEHLQPPRAPSGKLLSRYLVPYARGARNCVGMHLADAEIYIGLATFFRRFSGCLRLASGVGPESVEIWMDRFVPRERPGSQKVSVVIEATKRIPAGESDHES